MTRTCNTWPMRDPGLLPAVAVARGSATPGGHATTVPASVTVSQHVLVRPTVSDAQIR